MIPEQIEVNKSHLWKDKDVSKIQDLKTIDKTMDWSFSTPYKGCLMSLQEAIANKSEELSIDLS